MKKNILVFFLGTKAQFIKTIPVMNSINPSQLSVFLYDTCQHQDITIKQLESISTKFKHIKLSKNTKSAKNMIQIIKWFLSLLISLRSKEFKIENNNKSLCIIHGNTLSTVAGLIWAKINKIRILHIEGGYRSFNWFKPFPEEIIRYFVSKYSNYVICFDDNSHENLKNMKIKGEIIRISRNTIFDTIPKELNIDENSESKLIISIHRNENVYSKKIMSELVDFIIKLKQSYFENITWYLHTHTLSNLKKNKLLIKLENNLINTEKLIDHEQFIKELHSSDCVLTDGESVLEECSIIGVPTYALLNDLENKSSYSNNIFLSKYTHTENEKFFKNLKNFREPKKISNSTSPSKEISEIINNII